MRPVDDPRAVRANRRQMLGVTRRGLVENFHIAHLPNPTRVPTANAIAIVGSRETMGREESYSAGPCESDTLDCRRPRLLAESKAHGARGVVQTAILDDQELGTDIAVIVMRMEVAGGVIITA